jgi:predicted ATPase
VKDRFDVLVRWLQDSVGSVDCAENDDDYKAAMNDAFIRTLKEAGDIRSEVPHPLQALSDGLKNLGHHEPLFADAVSTTLRIIETQKKDLQQLDVLQSKLQELVEGLAELGYSVSEEQAAAMAMQLLRDQAEQAALDQDAKDQLRNDRGQAEADVEALIRTLRIVCREDGPCD